MGTPAHATASHPIEEFLEYDKQGHPVVLRRSVEHPGEPLAVALQKKAPAFSIKSPSSELPKTVSGGMGFFSDFQVVKNRLREKGLISR